MKIASKIMMFGMLCGSLNAAAQDAFTPYATSGQRIPVDDSITFTVVGNTQAGILPVKLSSGEDVSDIVFSNMATDDTDFVVLMGDLVRSGSRGGYKRFLRQAAPIVQQPVITVVGENEGRGDPRLENWAAVFPEGGEDIGHNRVGSWKWFDLRSGGHIFRFVVLDTNRDALGSRWNEQISWLPRALEGNFDSLFIFQHASLLELGGMDPEMNQDGIPRALMDIIEAEVDINKIRAVFSAATASSFVMRPDGPYGTVYIGAGGGGAPSDDLSRWYSAEAAQVDADVSLEPMFDVAVLRAMDRWSDDHPIPENVLDQAHASGVYDGFRGVVSGKHFPTYGWFSVQLNGAEISVTFHHILPDGSVESRYNLAFSEESGWTPGS